MRGIQRVGNLDRQQNEQIVIQGYASNLVLQYDAIDELHGDKGLPIELSDVINGANIGMVQGGGSLCFTLEASQGQRIASNIVRQEFESDETMQARVLGLINHSHSATTQLLDDPVVRDGLIDHWAEMLDLRNTASQ